MSLHRQSARRLSRAAQITALLALALLAVVIMAPRSEVKAPVVERLWPQIPSDTNEDQSTDTISTPRDQSQDWTTLSAALDASRSPIAGETTATTTANSSDTTTTAALDPDNPDEPRPQPAPPGWQYLGYARFSDGRLSALVTINNIQRFVQTGMHFDSYLISRITTSHVLLERDNQRFEVVRSEPAPFGANGSVVTTSPLSGNAAARNRNIILEERRLQLEEERNRRLREVGQAAAGAGLEEPQRL